MKLLFKVIPFFILPLFSSCGEDPCKTCIFTTYVVINEDQFFEVDSVNSEYCGEELQELIDFEYTVDTLINEETQDEMVTTTYISCY
ncbi:MAG: hypothetical protein ACI9B2_001437 [Flavobacteriales bacterium]|jgi:hypothetical protein